MTPLDHSFEAEPAVEDVRNALSVLRQLAPLLNRLPRTADARDLAQDLHMVERRLNTAVRKLEGLR